MQTLIVYDPQTGEVYVMNGEKKIPVYFIAKNLTPQQATEIINRHDGYEPEPSSC